MSSKNWFVDWFNSPYYHVLYQHRNHAEAEQFITNLIQYLQPQPGCTMLDAPCGAGRHAMQLGSKGFLVTGIDLAQESIAEANRVRQENMEFYRHDMRRPFRTNYFDYVFNLFTSLGYFDSEKENALPLQQFAAALKPGGLLIIDFLNADKTIANLVNHEIISKEGVEFTLNRKQENGYIIKTIDVKDKAKGSFRFQEKVRAFTLADFEKLFLQNKLKIKARFGNYQLDAFDPVHSDRLILVAQKA